MTVSSVSSTASTQQAANARAADGDYKTKGLDHEVKDSDGDYKPTKATPAPAPPAAATSSASVQSALTSLTKGGA